MKKFIFILGLLAIISCDKKPLQRLTRINFLPPGEPPSQFGNVIAKFKTKPSQILSQRLNVLFSVDTSRSNFQYIGDDGFPYAGSDPDGSRRFGNLLVYIDEILALPAPERANIKLGLILFDDTARQRIAFTNDILAFRNTVLSLRNAPQDNGATNYVSALQMATSMFQTEIGQGTDMKNIFIHISDGIPSVFLGGQYYIQQWIADIRPRMDALLAVQNLSRNITLQTHTGYYCGGFCHLPESNDARALLRTMATYGSGNFIDFASNQFDFNLFYNIRQKIQYVVKGFYGRNLNVVWNTQSKQREFDIVGNSYIPESIRTLNKLSTSNRDSNGNGIGDYVEWLLTGSYCQKDAAGNCIPQNTPFDPACNQYEKVPGARPVVYKEVVKGEFNGINKCEAFKLANQYYNNNAWGFNWFPFSLRLIGPLSLNPLNDNAYINTMGDGYHGNNAQKIAYGLSPSIFHDPDVMGKQQYDLKLLEEFEDGSRLFELRITQIVLASTIDKYTIYITQGAVYNDAKQYLISATKNFNLEHPQNPQDPKQLIFEPTDFVASDAN